MAGTNAGKCCVEWCSKHASARGMCSMHYRRARLGGDKNAPPMASKEEVDAFLDTVLSQDTDGCVTWPFHRNKYGYARRVSPGSSDLVHAQVCKIVHGPRPSQAHQCAHSCGNGHMGCVNPKHLRWDTAKGNAADRSAHGRTIQGEACRLSKLTEVDVGKIRALRAAGERPSRIAKAYSISPDNVRYIVKRRTWKHVA